MKGVAYAVTNGAKVVSMSLGGTATTSVERKFYEAAVASGALIVAATGNSADGVGFPAAYPGVLSVGATDSGGQLARFSNHDETMSVTAPGVTRKWTRLQDYLDEVAAARTYAGFHYRFSNKAGQDMGRKIAELTVGTQLRPAEASANPTR